MVSQGLITFGYVVCSVELIVAGFLMIMLLILLTMYSSANEQEMVHFQQKLMKYWNICLNFAIILCWTTTIILLLCAIIYRKRRLILPWLVWTLASIGFDIVSLIKKLCNCKKMLSESVWKPFAYVFFNLIMLAAQICFFYFIYLLYHRIEKD